MRTFLLELKNVHQDLRDFRFIHLSGFERFQIYTYIRIWGISDLYIYQDLRDFRFIHISGFEGFQIYTFIRIWEISDLYIYQDLRDFRFIHLSGFEGFQIWPLMSTHYWGENPTGNWTLTIRYFIFKKKTKMIKSI